MKNPEKEEDSKKSTPTRWIACSVEQDYYGDDRKQSRDARKRLSQRDRSKYKKTDHDKFEDRYNEEIKTRLEKKDLFRGRVLSVTSQGITTEFEGEVLTCFLRGLLKRENRRLKNIVTVGDFVYFEKMPDGEGYITNVEPRTSQLSRADNLDRRKEQLIAANIDQVIITVSVCSPQLNSSLIDRYIIAAIKGNMQPVVVVNKIDLLDSDLYDKDTIETEKETLQDCIAAYELANIPFIPLSADTGEGLDKLNAAMKDKSSVFSGQSGAGKSSLINAVTGIELQVGETVKRTKKGSHTTTRAKLVPLKCGGWCIDTPGIKSFGIWDLDPPELETYFSEIHEIGKECKFSDCCHLHEEKCKVIEAVESGQVSPIRYLSYQTLMQSIQEKHRRR